MVILVGTIFPCADVPSAVASIAALAAAVERPLLSVKGLVRVAVWQRGSRACNVLLVAQVFFTFWCVRACARLSACNSCMSAQAKCADCWFGALRLHCADADVQSG